MSKELLEKAIKYLAQGEAKEILSSSINGDLINYGYGAIGIGTPLKVIVIEEVGESLNEAFLNLLKRLHENFNEVAFILWRSLPEIACEKEFTTNKTKYFIRARCAISYKGADQ